MFQQPYLGKIVIYHSAVLMARRGEAPGGAEDFAAIVTEVLPHADLSVRFRVNLAVLTGDSQDPVRQINGVSYGTQERQYGWTDAACTHDNHR